MTYIPPPKTAFISALVHLARRERAPRWANSDGSRIYVWDGLHGELEVYNKRGRHLGAVDPETGEFIKDAVKGRTIDV
ncbi:colicin E3/pyocin S6 family cytotoxin [Polyangium jinanense]